MDSQSVVRRAFALRIGIAALSALALALPASAAAVPPPNDNFAGRTTLTLGNPSGPVSNADAGVETPEGLTVTDNAPGSSCNDTTDSLLLNTTGDRMGKTVWYEFEGNGAELVVTTGGRGVAPNLGPGSNFDTVLAVYTGTDGVIACDDDSNGSARSRVVIDSVDGETYWLQVGGWRNPADGVVASGEVVASVGSRSSNDNHANAQNVTAGDLITRSTRFATEEAGEDLDCGGAPLGGTVWFRYTAPATGDATIQATGTDTVLQVYRGSATSTPIACRDDGAEIGGGARVSVRVEPGDYYIQVGGYGIGPDARGGDATVGVEFVEDRDLDDDGSNRPADCNDGNPGIRPGANDVPENGVDEDCSGSDATNLDRDRDGFIANSNDCDDNNAGINPSATEIPGNGVDEDCRNGDAPAPLLRVPLTHLWQPSNAGPTDVLKLSVNVPTGARLRVKCKGGGCPGRARRGATFNGRSLARVARKFDLSKTLFKGRRLAVGAKVTLRVTQPNTIGRYWRFTMRKAKGPRLTRRCLAPNVNTLRTCPSG